MNHAGQVKSVGDKLYLSSGSPPDKLSVYHWICTYCLKKLKKLDQIKIYP